MSASPQTIAFITPRYGLEIVGGAERLVRALAELLVGHGHPVEVLTTCTESVAEIRNTLPPGVSTLNGVTVRRFLADRTDIARYYRVAALTQSGAPVSYSDQVEFMRHSLNSGPLYEHLRSHIASYRCAIFAPYMFGTTYWGMQAIPDKAMLIPCLHDEPYAAFSIVRDMLEQAQGIIFNVEPERDFAYNTLELVNDRSAVVGMDFAPQPAGDGVAFRAQHNLQGNLLLYTGRLEEGKNVPLLLDYFTRYADAHPGRWTLALTGVGPVPLPNRPDVVGLGFVQEHELPNVYAAATLYCQPSVNESLSIVLMESWLQTRPALVHSDCAVTRFHVEQSGGGLHFRSYEQFSAALDQVAADQQAVALMGERGRNYVLARYNPAAVYERLIEALDRFTAPRSLYDSLRQAGIVHARSFARERFDDRFAAILATVEAEAAGQGLAATQIAALRQGALVGMPDYQVQSGAPYGLGRLIVWLRRNLTSHLREPYLDPIIARQEQFNRQLLDTLLPALERSVRAQQRLERQVRLLEQQINQREEQSSKGDSP